jgi:hypothetical protein
LLAALAVAEPPLALVAAVELELALAERGPELVLELVQPVAPSTPAVRTMRPIRVTGRRRKIFMIQFFNRSQ